MLKQLNKFKILRTNCKKCLKNGRWMKSYYFNYLLRKKKWLYLEKRKQDKMSKKKKTKKKKNLKN